MTTAWPEGRVARGPGVSSAAGRAGRWRHLSVVTVVIACCAALGLLLRGYQLARPGCLLGVTGYDDGVLFGNVLRLVSGCIPYRDFQMVQPPGSMLILAPVALLAKVIGTAQGLAIARVLTVAADVTNIVLIGKLIRQRGPLAVGIACGAYALYPDALMADRTFMLEPWLNLCCLIAAVLLFDGDPLADAARPGAGAGGRSPRLSGTARLACAGLAFGFGAMVKIWAVVPYAIALVILVTAAFLAAPSLMPVSVRDLRARLRPAAIMTGGAVLGLGVPLLPFAVMAPGGLTRGVVIGQLARNSGGRRDPVGRLTDLAGLRVFPAKLPNESVLAMFALVMLACYAWAFFGGPARRRRGSAWLDVYALTSAVLTTAMFCWPRLYYPHYGAFAGPYLSLAVALPIGLLATGQSAGQPETLHRSAVTGTGEPGSPAPGAATRTPLATAVTAALALLVALGVAGVTETQLHQESRLSGGPVATADRLIPPAACVLTNVVSHTVAANRFFSADPGCPPMVDPFGTLFAMTSGDSINAPPSELRPVRELWQSSLAHATYVWITSDTTNQIPWDPQLLGYFHGHFRLIAHGLKIKLGNPAAPKPGLYRRT